MNFQETTTTGRHSKTCINKWPTRYTAMKEESPGKSLAIGLSIIIIILLVVAIIGSSILTNSTSQFDKIIFEFNRKIELANNMHQYARMRLVILHNMAITDDPFILDEHVLEHQQAGSTFLEKREALLKLPQTEKELQLLKSQREAAIISVAAQRRLVTMLQNNAGHENLHDKAETMLHMEVTPLQDVVISILDEYISYQTGEMVRIQKQISYQSRRTLLVFYLMLALGLLVSIYIAAIVNQHFKKTIHIIRNREITERTIRENILDGLITIDTNGIIESCNSAAYRMFGYSQGELHGKKVNILMPEPHSQQHDDYIRRYLRTGEAHIVGIGREVTALKKDGTEFPVELSVQKIVIEHRILFIGLIHDISERKAAERKLIQYQQELEQRVAQRTADLQEANDKLLQLANYDPLTGLANRTLFCNTLKLVHEQSVRHGERYALLYMDLDGFKDINDQYGHEMGDCYLQEISQRMQQVLRAEDILGRFGGDEFVFLASRLAAPDDAHRIAEKICHTIAEPVMIKGQRCTTTASIGISLYPENSDDPDELLKQADTAMYVIKRRSKNGIHRYSAEDDPSFRRNS